MRQLPWTLSPSFSSASIIFVCFFLSNFPISLLLRFQPNRNIQQFKRHTIPRRTAGRNYPPMPLQSPLYWRPFSELPDLYTGTDNIRSDWSTSGLTVSPRLTHLHYRYPLAHIIPLGGSTSSETKSSIHIPRLGFRYLGGLVIEVDSLVSVVWWSLSSGVDKTTMNSLLIHIPYLIIFPTQGYYFN